MDVLLAAGTTSPVVTLMLGVDHRRIAYLDDFDQNLAPAAELGWM